MSIASVKLSVWETFAAATEQTSIVLLLSVWSFNGSFTIFYLMFY